MGHEMYLVRDDNRTLYALGKSKNGLHVPLQELQDLRTGTVVLSDADVLMEFLLDGILENGNWKQPFDYRPITKQLAERMIHWGGGNPVRVAGGHEVTQLEIRKEDRYIITDSRYYPEFIYYDVFMYLDRVLQGQISDPCGVAIRDLPAVHHVRSFGISRFNRPPTTLIATEEGFVEQSKDVWEHKFLIDMQALKPLTTNRGCGMFACAVMGPHDHGLRDTSPPEVIFCGCDCHDNPVVCTGFHFCCHEVNEPRLTQAPRPPRKPIKIGDFKTFVMPVIRSPAPKLIAEDLMKVDPGAKELFRDVARHAVEVMKALKKKPDE